MFRNKWRKADRASKEKQPELVFPKQEYLDDKNHHRTYSCIHCRAHLADHDEIVSKLFQGNNGKAYLFNKVVNVGCKEAVERRLLTGLHAVADIYCDNCETTLGWKYEQAYVEEQKYKEGKYIIELVHMIKENNWDLNSHNVKDILDQCHKSENNNQQETTGPLKIASLHNNNSISQTGPNKTAELSYGGKSLSGSINSSNRSEVSLIINSVSQESLRPIPSSSSSPSTSSSISCSPIGKRDSLGDKHKPENEEENTCLFQKRLVTLGRTLETRIEIARQDNVNSVTSHRRISVEE